MTETCQRHLRWLLLLLRTTGLLLLLRLLLRPLMSLPPTTSNWRLKSVLRNPANTSSDCATPATPVLTTVPISTVTLTMTKWHSRVTRVIPTSTAAVLINWNWMKMMMIWAGQGCPIRPFFFWIESGCLCDLVGCYNVFKLNESSAVWNPLVKMPTL